MNNGKMLVLNDLNVWYTPGKPVHEKLSMELGTNEVIGLIGLNGAGKTTFIKTLSELLNTFQVRAAWWQGKPLLFRDREFKKERYVVFAEDHSFQFFTFREYFSVNMAVNSVYLISWQISKNGVNSTEIIIPLIMFLVAGLIGMWPVSIWVLLCIVLAEVLSLSFVIRRI